MRPVAKLQSLVREMGPYNAALYLLDRLCQRTRLPCRIYRYYFVSQPVAGPALPERWTRKVAVAEFSNFDPRLRALPLTDEVIAYRFDQGARCFCAFDETGTLGCLWLALERYDEDEVRARFVPTPPEAAAWDFDVYVDPDHRGKLVFPRLWDAANAWLASRGKRWTVSRISAFNMGSIQGHKRMGARIVGSATFVRVSALQLCFCDLGPRYHVSAGPRGTPLIEVPARPVGAGSEA